VQRHVRTGRSRSSEPAEKNATCMRAGQLSARLYPAALNYVRHRARDIVVPVQFGPSVPRSHHDVRDQLCGSFMLIVIEFLWLGFEVVASIKLYCAHN
jgi:hypothetical protein